MFRGSELNITNKLATYSATINYIKSSDIIKEEKHYFNLQADNLLSKYNTWSLITPNLLDLNSRLPCYKGRIKQNDMGYHFITVRLQA